MLGNKMFPFPNEFKFILLVRAAKELIANIGPYDHLLLSIKASP
jgi:hypothetical protein